jgi:hypothetical protein
MWATLLKMLTTLQKNANEKMIATFLKMLMKKYLHHSKKILKIKIIWGLETVKWVVLGHRWLFSSHPYPPSRRYIGAFYSTCLPVSEIRAFVCCPSFLLYTLPQPLRCPTTPRLRGCAAAPRATTVSRKKTIEN